MSMQTNPTSSIWEPMLRTHQTAKLRKTDSCNNCEIIFPIDLFYAYSKSYRKNKTKQNQEHVKNIAISKKKIRIILLTNPGPFSCFLTI